MFFLFFLQLTFSQAAACSIKLIPVATLSFVEKFKAIIFLFVVVPKKLLVTDVGERLC